MTEAAHRAYLIRHANSEDEILRQSLKLSLLNDCLGQLINSYIEINYLEDGNSVNGKLKSVYPDNIALSLKIPKSGLQIVNYGTIAIDNNNLPCVRPAIKLSSHQPFKH